MRTVAVMSIGPNYFADEVVIVGQDVPSGKVLLGLQDSAVIGLVSSPYSEIREVRVSLIASVDGSLLGYHPIDDWYLVEYVATPYATMPQVWFVRSPEALRLFMEALRGPAGALRERVLLDVLDKAKQMPLAWGLRDGLADGR